MNLTPTPVQIVDVLEARYTATPGFIDLLVTIEGPEAAIRNAVGDNPTLRTNGEVFRADVEYTWKVDEEYDNSWNAAGFLLHPDFPIAEYVAPPVTADMVKAEAARRIGEAIPRWMIEREWSGGEPVPQERKDEAALIRLRSNEIEQLDPIPADFREDTYWE